MTLRALLLAALVFPVGAASAAPSHLWVAGPALSVRAGMGGAARPGRWLPVAVDVAAGDTAWRGRLNVEWGGAVARRDVELVPASTIQITLFVRTIAASPVLRVTLTSTDGALAAATDTALTLVSVDGPIRLCIGDVAAECSVRLAAAEAPVDWRALDLADEVLWTEPPNATRREALNAYALWQAERWWQDSGFVDPVVASFDTTSRLAERTSFALGVFVAVLLMGTAVTSRRRASVVLLLGIPLAITIGGVGLVARRSHDVDMHAASFVHEFAGLSESIVLMKGDIEHPGADRLELMPDVQLASLEVGDPQTNESTTSLDGRALYRAASGRGVRQRFELTGSLDGTWLAAATADGGVVIENRSPFALADCTLRSTNLVAIGAMGPGASVRAASAAPLAPGDAIVCRLPADWLKWSAPRAAVTTRGDAFVILHIWPGITTTASGANAPR